MYVYGNTCKWRRRGRRGGSEGAREESACLGHEGTVAAVDHEDVGALPLCHLLRRGRRAHLGGIGIVQLLGDEAAGTKGKRGGGGGGGMGR